MVKSSSVSFPHCCFTRPVICFQLPATWSQFMQRSFLFCRRVQGKLRLEPWANQGINPVIARTYLLIIERQKLCHVATSRATAANRRDKRERSRKAMSAAARVGRKRRVGL